MCRDKGKFSSSRPLENTKSKSIGLRSLLLVAITIIGLSTLAPTCQGSSSSLAVRKTRSPSSPYQFVQSNWDNGDKTDVVDMGQSWPSHSIRKKRDVSSSSNGTDASAKIKRYAAPLNDSHNQLLVFWAGEDVILCLAKDINVNSSSTLWISRDYGGQWTNATKLLVQHPSDNAVNTAVPPPVLEGFFNHPSNNGHFVFTDTQNGYIFTTRNYGAEFQARKVDFTPDEILFDPHSESNLVAYEKSELKRMWVSINFGRSWTLVDEHVKSLSWDETVMPAALYMQREEPSSGSSNNATVSEPESRSVILKSDSLFLDPKSTEVIISGVEEFEIKDDFMFATRQKDKDNYELLISYKKSDFRTAQFPASQQTKHFFIAEVSDDGQIFVCVVQNESISNLYIGSFPVSDNPDEKENPRFSLSLERILYFKPNVTWSDSWLNEVSSEPFVDLHHVEGLRGVYIASQLKPSTVSSGKFNMNEVISLITYDQGGEWQVLKPPEFEHDGRPIYCQYSGGGNCSLHISQRLSELYPRTRAVPILSKKSAVGMILATGTVNTTLKGHLGVYLSTDGAVSWRQVLQGNYLYAFGDHGGIIVATKMYRIGDDTNELLYSIDEGETWERYEFYEEKVRIMGLMTEPGENTTSFFIFGSVAPPKPNGTSKTPSSSRHTWVLIKVDFRDVFEKSCTDDDYKDWSPWDVKQGRHCILGRKETYRRRIPSRKCYNGQTFMRHVTTKSCACTRADFECDFGYVIDSKSYTSKDDKDKDCLQDNSEGSAGVKSEWCRPSDKFYNKTKGYRKIPGDTCEEGDWVSKYLPEVIPCEVRKEPEFLLVAKRDSVLRIDLNHLERVETLPLTKVQAVIAVDFNLKNNCVFWSDVSRKTINKLHLDGKSQPEVLVSSDLGSVEGLAFDWNSNLLYYTDGGQGKIEVVHAGHHPENGKRLRKRIISKPVVEKPRGIAIHPEMGYLFWTDWSTQNPGIGRAHLDGSNVKRIIQNDNNRDNLHLKWPNGITVDFHRHRIFWVDANLDRVMSSDFNGENVQIILERDPRVSHAFAVGVYKNSIYWDDWTTRGIYSAQLLPIQDKTDPDKLNVVANSTFQIKGNLPRLMDLKVYGTGMQNSSKNLCASPETSKCSPDHLCFLMPNETASCQCADGFIPQNETCVCPDGRKPNATTGSCESKCEKGTFKCRTHSDYCIISAWRCDNENDCGDWSDEENCENQVCEDPSEFKCKFSGRCIPNSFKCDFDHDCGAGDTSDEDECTGKTTCDDKKEFQCKGSGRCIPKSFVCDQDDDCLDGSDEENCEGNRNSTSFECLPSEYKCPNENKCLSPDWICDFDRDCTDGADEQNCTATTCSEWKFPCNTTGHCIMKTWVCDGDADCPDSSDELNCPATTTPAPTDSPFHNGQCSQLSQMFECLASRECIPIFWKCDHVKDCQDGSDELGCTLDPDKASNTTIAPPKEKCEDDHWRCNDGTCLVSYSVCDGFRDCPGGDDELNCHNISAGGCPSNTRRCGESRVCVPFEKWCNGKKECPNGQDEKECAPGGGVKEICNEGGFTCDDNNCMPLLKLCDKRVDCFDGSDEDEEVCKKHNAPVYQVEGISVTEKDASWIMVDWWLPSLSGSIGKILSFTPSICELESGHCQNYTTGGDVRKYRFVQLSPYKKYSVTVYVSLKDTPDKTYPPFVYINATTAESSATQPIGLVVKQNTTDDLILSWKRPHSPNGKITGYKVYFQPPIPPVGVYVDKEELVISNKQSDPNFQPGDNYSFWVNAVNGHGEGEASDVVTYTYNGEVAFLKGLQVKETKENFAKFEWEPANDNVDTYVVLLSTDVPGSMYTFRNRTEIKDKMIQFDKLAAGTRYKLTVIPKFKGTHGVTRSLSFSTSGKPLPKVESFNGTASPDGKVQLVWKAVKLSGHVMYGIYYGKTVQEIAERRARIVTSSTQTEAHDLESCENYLFDIGVVTENNGIGPLTEKPLQVITKMDAKSPPKAVKIEPVEEEDGGSMLKSKISWKSPCDVMDKAVGYNIIVVETTHNRTYGLSNISYSHSSRLSHEVRLQYGGQYLLTVSTNVDGGKPSAPVSFEGPPIPFPEKINECSECNPLTIFWNEPHLPKLVTKKGHHSYVVWLSKDQEFSDPIKYETHDISFRFSDLQDDGIYWAAVSVKDSEGLESPRSSPIVIQHRTDGASAIVLPGSSALAISVSVIIVILLLGGVLAVFVIRHKRLQTSFLNFASSHYSSNSGAATFQQTIEVEDSPVIRGFSDDEPLLVA